MKTIRNKVSGIRGVAMDCVCKMSLKVFEASVDKCAPGFLYEPKVDIELLYGQEKK